MRKHYLFDSKLYYYFLHIVLFFYIYSVQFVGVPFGIGTRVFMGIIGLFGSEPQKAWEKDDFMVVY